MLQLDESVNADCSHLHVDVSLLLRNDDGVDWVLALGLQHPGEVALPQAVLNLYHVLALLLVELRNLLRLRLSSRNLHVLQRAHHVVLHV